MATDNWNRILNPDVTYEALYGTGNQGKKTVVTGGRNAFANYGAENAEKENVQFMFPGPTFTDIENRTHVMRRGFIRSIIFDPLIYNNYVNAGNYTKIAGSPANNLTPATPTEMSQGHHRVNFQFNPEYLERAVKQEMGTMNPLLQNPANLTQSVPGTAKFGFSLMFNRELEVQRGALKGKQLKFDYENPDFETLYKSADPETIGVLADLLLFDSIIGQGISPDTVEAINAFTNNIVNAANAVTKPVQLIDEDGNPKYKEDPNHKGSYIPDTVEIGGETPFVSLMDNLNFGNSAFLNPLPVRIVFSDYFMVEGLITASTVGFQKFSKDLVPTVCTVNIAVDALYLGFAQKNAYLTNQLSVAAKAEADQSQKNQKEADEAKKRLTRYFSELSVMVNEWDRTKANIITATQQDQTLFQPYGYLAIPPGEKPLTPQELEDLGLEGTYQDQKYKFWKTNKPKSTPTAAAAIVNTYGDAVYAGYLITNPDGANRFAFVTFPMWILGSQGFVGITGVPDEDRKKNGWKKDDTQVSGYVPIQLGFKNQSSFTSDSTYSWENVYPGQKAPSFTITDSAIVLTYVDKNGNDLPDKTLTGKIECIAVKDGEITDIRTDSNGKVTQPWLVGGLQLGNKIDFGGKLASSTFEKYNNGETVFFKEATIIINLQLTAEIKSTSGDTLPIITNADFVQLQLGYTWDKPFVGKGVVRKYQKLNPGK